MTAADRLAALGLALPTAPVPLAAYVPAVRTGSLVFTSGQLPLVDGALAVTGVVGEEAGAPSWPGGPPLVDPDAARELLGLLGRHEGADLADRRQAPLDHRQLPGGEDEVARAHGRDVHRDRRHDGGELQAELREPGTHVGHALGRLR